METKSRIESFNRDGGVWKQNEFESRTLDGSILDYKKFLIKREGGKFFVAVDDENNSFVEIPEEIAKVIIVGIEAEKRIKERKPKWEERAVYKNESFDPEWESQYELDVNELDKIKKESLLYHIFSRFYCHRVVRFILGISEEKDDLKDRFSTLPCFNFKFVKSLEELKQRTKDMKFPIVGRIVEWEKVPEKGNFFEDKHTFLVLGVDSLGRYICFEKSGGFDYPVRLTTIDPIYDFYSKDSWGYQKSNAWAFQELDKVEKIIGE
jgi:hypothetical protein